MHWFWRAAIAVGIGSGLGVSFLVFVAQALTPVVPDLVEAVLVIGSYVLATTATLVILRYRPTGPTDSETRCRKCGYILRGISEPRCPECGEVV